MNGLTPIAPADGNGEIIGSPVVAPGVYKTTTEVYPDSPRATPEQCNAAQAVAVCAAIDYALAHR
ncbi:MULTISPECIES: hypothetical protein [unclassified Microbulbifer]|uniref:hypothetical protein n=1 Tax=unclassified Microbulbifer TaxID=2619833 RepID=UPI0027E5613C|nr:MULTISPECIES: hypothetical protein [unclassified Microbulbifer]